MLLRSHRFNVLALAAAAALAGCADFDSGQAWFAKPLDIAGRGAGYSFSELAETKKQQRAVGSNDLVNASGSCPAPPSAAAAAPPPAPAANAAAAPAAPPAAPDATPSDPLLGGGIGLGMSECDVVFRAGPPSSVQIGSAPNGDRLTTLTFESGPRPGIYRFVRGSLTEMNAVAAPAAPPPQVAKKKPAKPKKSASN